MLNLKVLDNRKYKEYLKEEVKLISPTAARLLQPKGPERVTKKLNRKKSKKHSTTTEVQKICQNCMKVIE